MSTALHVLGHTRFDLSIKDLIHSPSRSRTNPIETLRTCKRQEQAMCTRIKLSVEFDTAWNRNTLRPDITFTKHCKNT